MSNKLTLKPYLSKDKKVYLCGTTSLEYFIKKIGTSNLKHITRIKRYYPKIMELNRKNASIA